MEINKIIEKIESLKNWEFNKLKKAMKFEEKRRIENNEKIY